MVCFSPDKMCVGVFDEKGLLADEKKMRKKKDPPLKQKQKRSTLILWQTLSEA